MSTNQKKVPADKAAAIYIGVSTAVQADGTGSLIGHRR
jgi:hypothetical protein